MNWQGLLEEYGEEEDIDYREAKCKYGGVDIPLSASLFSPERKRQPRSLVL